MAVNGSTTGVSPQTLADALAAATAATSAATAATVAATAALATIDGGTP